MTILALLAPVSAEARGALPPGFVYLRDIDPSIAQDIDVYKRQVSVSVRKAACLRQ